VASVTVSCTVGLGANQLLAPNLVAAMAVLPASAA